MSLVRNENYVNIQGWMINELNLKDNDLMVYSIIYGFTQDGTSWFTGSRQYLADWCQCTRQGIDKNLKNLIDNDLIIKEKMPTGGICRYKCNPKYFPVIQSRK